MLEHLPTELSQEAARLLKSNRAHVRHLNALRRAARDNNIETVCREIVRIGKALMEDSVSSTTVETLVTLSQVAPLADLKKRTLERYLSDGKIPDPDFRGGGGKASKWKWNSLRPALEKVCDRRLPVQFPAAQII